MTPTPAISQPAFLSVQEVADLLALSTTTVRRWLRSGRLPGVRIGAEWRISAAALDLVLAPSRGEGTA